MGDSFTRKLVIGITLLLLSILVFSFASFFIFGRIEAKGARILELRRTLERYSEAASKLASLKNTSLEAHEYEKMMDLFLPPQDQLWNFPDFAKAIARENHVDLTVSFQAAAGVGSPSGGGSVVFDMVAKGAFSDIIEFTEALEKKTTRFWVGLDTMDLTRDGEIFTLKSQGKVFYR